MKNYVIQISKRCDYFPFDKAIFIGKKYQLKLNKYCTKFGDDYLCPPDFLDQLKND